MSIFTKLSRDTQGKIAVLFGLTLVPMAGVAGFAIDFQNTIKRKAKVQLVIDSAVLAAARAKQGGATDTEIKLVVQQFMDGQISDLGGLECDPTNVYISTSAEEIDADILCEQTTSLVRVLGRDVVPFKVSSASEYGIDKLDVAFMFDISGSMNNSNRLTNLKAAANEAIDVLLPVDAPAALIEDTRLAMVSYNAMVDAGDFFFDVTGETATRTYTHDLVVETGGNAETDLGDDDSKFDLGLYDANTNELITYFGDDAVLAIDPDDLDDLAIAVTIPSSSSIYGDDESVKLKLSGETSRTQTENGSPYAVFGDNSGNYYGHDFEYGEYKLRIEIYEKNNLKGDRLEKETFEFEIVEGGGTATTTVYPQSYTLTSTCVWERDGDEKFTDAAPGAGAYLAHRQAWFVEDEDDDDGGYWEVGHPNRPDHSRYDGDECRSHEPVELTNDRTTLTNYVTSLTAGGYTAGHLGVAWTWYLVSENWNGVFDGDAAPFDYSEPDSAKVVILMTDGAFNTEIFPEQGSSDDQARDLCDNMKALGVQVYAVALNAPDEGKAVLSYCASGTDYFFEPETAAELTEAYRQIATNISDLRISK